MTLKAGIKNPLKSDKTLSKLKGFRQFEAGETILHKDEVSDQVFLIMDGAVKVSTFSISGKEVWHSTLEAGTFFGEIAAFTESKRSATITAMTLSKIAVLSKNDFFLLIREDADIAMWLLSEMASRLKMTTEKLSTQVAQNNAQRVRRELISLATPPSGVDGDYIISPKPKISEMAQRLNTDRENVSREISALIKSGIIERTRHSLIIKDIDYLSSTSQF